MTNVIQPVQPGDLITAGVFNQFIDALAALDSRVTVLESEEPPEDTLALTGFIPERGPYRIGDELQVLGRNFRYSSGATRVFLNSVRVKDLAGSSDERLVFTIPTVPAVSEDGTSVTLQISNQIQPPLILSIVLQAREPSLFGTVGIEYKGSQPERIEPGAVVMFEFQIKAEVSDSANFLISPRITINGNSVWADRLSALNVNQEELPGDLIYLEDEEDVKTFYVRLAEVPSDADGVEFELTVDADAGRVHGSSGAKFFTVGEETIPTDPAISRLEPTHPPGNVVTVMEGSRANKTFTAELLEVDTYLIEVNPMDTADGPTEGWVILRTTSASETVSEVPAKIFPNVRIIPTGEATETGRAELVIRRDGQTGRASSVLELVLQKKGA